MAKKPSLKSVNRFRFFKNNDKRKELIEKAPATPLPSSFPVNDLSEALHPDRQYVKISEIKIWDNNCKSFTFVPDETRGTTKLAYFQAGSYVSLFVDIKNQKLNRPYSISSSPREALEGKYTITIKRVPGGVVSNYMLDHAKVGDDFAISGPLGQFVYLPIRDGKTVIGVAGGSGITPFYSFAKAIAEGDEDFHLILLYGSRTEEDILFKKEFDEIQKQTEKVKVVHVLSDENKEGYEQGFIRAGLIKKYAPKEDYPKNIAVPEKVQFHVSICDKVYTFDANSEDTILQSLEKNGISAPARCRSGECGWCHSLLLAGEVYCPKKMEHRREADCCWRN